MARVAITGVAGFVGSHVAEAALSRGFFVRGLDVIDRAPAGVERVVGDVGDAAAAARLCSGADFVVHAAAIVGEGGRKELFWRINVEGTRVVARAAREAGVRRFVHISSAMVYGCAGGTARRPVVADAAAPYAALCRFHREGAAGSGIRAVGGTRRRPTSAEDLHELKERRRSHRKWLGT